MVRLQLFDSPQIESLTTSLLQFRSRQTEALSYYLATTPGQHQRLRLANLLWSELPEGTALGNLRYTLWNLRQVIHDLPLQTDRTTITLQLHGGYRLLCEQFLRLPWNQEIVTLWDMLPLSNSNVTLYFLHGYPG